MKSNGKRYTIQLDGLGPVLLERSGRARRIGITVRPFHGIRVAVPRGISWGRAERFALDKIDWIRRQLAYAQEREKEALQLAEERPLPDRTEAKRLLTARLAELAQRHGYTYRRVRIANQKSRWGSCSGRNTISLNVQLLRLPTELHDYVILHELVHTRIKNHGAAFWRELDRHVDDSAVLRKQLRGYTIMP